MHKVFLPTLQREAFLCYECEALYETLDDIQQVRFVDCRTYLEQRGAVQDYTEMTKCDETM